MTPEAKPADSTTPQTQAVETPQHNGAEVGLQATTPAGQFVPVTAVQVSPEKKEEGPFRRLGTWVKEHKRDLLMAAAGAATTAVLTGQVPNPIAARPDGFTPPPEPMLPQPPIPAAKKHRTAAQRRSK